MLNVLLVEDTKIDLLTFTKAISQLKDFNIKLDIAGTAEEALSMIQAGPRYDLVVTDYVLPGMNGKEFANMLKQRGREQFELFYYTGDPDVVGRKRCIPKPAKPEHIRVALEAVQTVQAWRKNPVVAQRALLAALAVTAPVAC